jgi:DNA polymerase
MREIRGRWFRFENIPLMVTYHPSYLLRNNTPEAKRQVWEDMLTVLDYLHLPVSDKQRAYFL